MPCVFVQSICCEGAAGLELQQQNCSLAAQLRQDPPRAAGVWGALDNEQWLFCGTRAAAGLAAPPVASWPSFGCESPLWIGTMPNVGVRPQESPAGVGLGSAPTAKGERPNFLFLISPAPSWDAAQGGSAQDGSAQHGCCTGWICIGWMQHRMDLHRHTCEGQTLSFSPRRVGRGKLSPFSNMRSLIQARQKMGEGAGRLGSGLGKLGSGSGRLGSGRLGSGSEPGQGTRTARLPFLLHPHSSEESLAHTVVLKSI